MAGVPIATYRLQLHAGFTLDDAAAIVPYLARLGVSHLYLSPISQAAAGSTHGYDVVDHGRVNAELGGLPALYRLHEQAVSHDLRILLDIVPNHVGLDMGANPWFRDVLRFGQASPFAPYFDIDWEGQPQMRSGVLVFPVLGQPFGAALEAGELRLALEEGEIVVRYWEHSFPLTLRSYQSVLGLPPGDLGAAVLDHAAVAELAGLFDAWERGGPSEFEGLRARLRELCDREPAICSWVQGRLQAVNGTPGDPSSFDQLETLLSAQHYWLAYWRVSGEEINYRRFFDINGLAGVRVEYPPAFEAVHQLAGDLVRQGVIHGLRVDHIDGLYDPARYLARLREAVAPPDTLLYVEKILEAGELLRATWPVDGTTGYDFLATAEGLFVDRAGERPLDDAYRAFTGRGASFAEECIQAKRQVAEQSFAGEVTVLALQLYRLAQRRRRYRDITLRAAREAIEALMASFPIYRTYLEEDRPGPGDEELISEAVERAMRLAPGTPEEAFNLLAETLLLSGDLSQDEMAVHIHLRRRFQQLSGPVMAKGVEDTTFFRYCRLLSLNEVGGDPGVFGRAPDDVHAFFARRAEMCPRSMSATDTHDTKRSADARARLHVLSEVSRDWHREVRAWSQLNSRWCTMAEGGRAPARTHEYYLYQSLVAAWEGEPSAAFVARVQEHLVKAAREGKEQTSWTRPSERYEQALREFARNVLVARRARPFRRRLAAFVARTQPAADINSLALLTLKCLAPGVPDIYQGCEFPFLALTDPDNRRRVDFAVREATLAGLSEPWPGGLEPASAEGRMSLLAQLLRLRREHGAAREGDYTRVEVSGAAAAHVFAFARQAGDGDHLVVVVPRLVSGLAEPGGRLRAADFAGTVLDLPGSPTGWRDALGGRQLSDDGARDVQTLFAAAPLAVLVGGAR